MDRLDASKPLDGRGPFSGVAGPGAALGWAVRSNRGIPKALAMYSIMQNEANFCAAERPVNACLGRGCRKAPDSGREETKPIFTGGRLEAGGGRGRTDDGGRKAESRGCFTRCTTRDTNDGSRATNGAKQSQFPGFLGQERRCAAKTKPIWAADTAAISNLRSHIPPPPAKTLWFRDIVRYALGL